MYDGAMGRFVFKTLARGWLARSVHRGLAVVPRQDAAVTTMNLVLLFERDFVDERRVILTDRRFRHIAQVIRPKLGDTVSVGLLDAQLGEAEVLSLGSGSVELSVVFERDPPRALPVVLLMALPRPRSLFKSLQMAATMGVKEIHLFNTSRVDKSFWQSRRLEQEAIEEDLIIGLEQARDTAMPRVHLHRLFSHLVNDELPAITAGKARYLAHPSPEQKPCPHSVNGPAVLAIGPERGLIEHEVRCFVESGFEVVGLNERILRVEQALPVMLGKMFD